MIRIENPIRDGQESATLILSSQTWTCPKSGYYRISAVGAGGSGGLIESGYGAGAGGGGGAFCEKTAFILKGVEIVITIGAGGASRSSNGTGYNGGNTTVVGGDFNLSAGGGYRGTNNGTAINTAISTAPNGGSASGGDINSDGGKGGTVTSRNNFYRGTGGGSAGSPLGAGGNGGIAGIVGNHGTGGGGIGGDGFGNNTFWCAGGGAGGNAVEERGAPNIFGQHSSAGYLTQTGHCAGFETLYSPFYFLGGGVDAFCNTATPTHSGAGAGGSFRSLLAFVIPAGILGGAAGAGKEGNVSVLVERGIGGGGGGVAGSIGCISAAASNGIVTIEYMGLRIS